MNAPTPSHQLDRRQFLTEGVVTGTSLYFGCPVLASLALARDPERHLPLQAKVTEDSNMSLEQVFNFAFRDTLIHQLTALLRQVGREQLVDMLKNATDEVWVATEAQERFEANLQKGFWNQVLTTEVTQNRPDLQTFKVTECLWAKTFREADAADLGYTL